MCLNAESSWCEIAQKYAKLRAGKKERRTKGGPSICAEKTNSNSLSCHESPKTALAMIQLLGEQQKKKLYAQSTSVQHNYKSLNALVVECLLPAGARGCRQSVLSTSRSRHHCNGEILARISECLYGRESLPLDLECGRTSPPYKSVCLCLDMRSTLLR